jgi:hypothetical protein
MAPTSAAQQGISSQLGIVEGRIKKGLQKLIPMGSPRGVPVPWTAMPAMALAGKSAARRAARMRLFWEGPLGAVSEDDLPSWLMAEPCAVIITVLIPS